MKGADVAMASIVQYNDWLEEEVNTQSVRTVSTGWEDQGHFWLFQFESVDTLLAL